MELLAHLLVNLGLVGSGRASATAEFNRFFGHPLRKRGHQFRACFHFAGDKHDLRPGFVDQMSDPVGDVTDVLADRLLNPPRRTVRGSLLDAFAVGTPTVHGDIRAGVIHGRRQITRVQYPVFDDGHQIGQL